VRPGPALGSGIAQAHPNEGACAEVRLGWARAHTASPRPVPGLCSCALKARPSLSALLAHSSAKPKCACKAVDIYIFASLSGLQSRHGLHRQLLQHVQRQKPAYARPLTPSWWMKRAPASDEQAQAASSVGESTGGNDGGRGSNSGCVWCIKHARHI
jgi:hypothetical protein